MSWPDFEARLSVCAGQDVQLGGEGAATALEAADRLAIFFQSRLFASQQHALGLALAWITFLALCACLTLNPLFTLFGPVAVFAMILRFDAIRQSAPVFRFAALRLAAETLRVLMALEGKADLRQWVLTQRLHSAHAVADLAKAATTSLSETTLATPAFGDAWSGWREGQALYFARASAREARLSRRARLGFRGAFSLVALVGLGLGVWILIDPQAAMQPLYRQGLAAASGLGSAGLAWITLARERKCFEQSIDYGHMHGLFTDGSGEGHDGLLVCEAVAEHTRWAVRMAGHFRQQPN